MEYRTMGKTGIKTSLLGFGCMRFPKNQDGHINEALAEQMIDKAIAGGVTYIDTAYPYHNGESEPFVGRVLDKYDRGSYLLATKLPVWLVNKPEDAEEIFQKQLNRLNKDYVDFYLLHALDKEGWEKVLRFDLIGLCEKLKAQGKIRAFGFSFHDDYQVFEEIITYRDWDFCQIQFNYMDTEYQAGIKGYELAKKRGIPIVVMEPLRGGALAGLQGDIAEQLHNIDQNRSIASWGYRWVADHDNVKVILSGMSDYEQVEDNLTTFEKHEKLTAQEQKAVAGVRETIEARVKNNCTGCRYCMPCPAGVNIPGSFQIWNSYAMYGNAAKAKNAFAQMGEKEGPTNCVKCGKCEVACPQHIAIRADLEEVVRCMELL